MNFGKEDYEILIFPHAESMKELQWSQVELTVRLKRTYILTSNVYFLNELTSFIILIIFLLK